MALFKNIAQGVIDAGRAGNYNGTGLGDAPTTGDPFYDDLFGSNPYRNLTYNKSWWQSLLEGLGFRTSYDTWREQAEVNSNEFDARIMEMMKQNQYNSPSAESARMRQAGLNPDLLGTGDVEPGFSEAPDPNGMQPNPADDFMQFGETFMSVLGKTMTLYKDFKGLAELDNLIEAGDLQNIKTMYDSIDSFIESRFSEPDFINRSSYNNAVARTKSMLESELSGDYEGSSAFRLGVDKRNWKRWTETAGERLDSLMGDARAFESFAKAGKARSSASGVKLDPLYTKTDSADVVIIGTADIIAQYYPQLLDAKAKNDAYQETLRTDALEIQGIEQDIQHQEVDYLYEHDAGVKSAQEKLAKYDADWYNHRIKAVTDDMQRQILDFLKEKAKTSRFASLMLMNWTLGNMVNMGVSANVGAQVGLNFGLGANIANTVSRIIK